MKKSSWIVGVGILFIASAILLREFRYDLHPSETLREVLFSGGMSLAIATAWALKNKDALRPKFASAVFGMATLIAVGFLGIHFWGIASEMKARAQGVNHWPTTSAKILRQDVFASRPGKYGPRWWAPIWEYTYEVDGKAYRALSNEIEFAYRLEPFPSESLALAASRRRPIGETVPAYYDPANPQASILDPAIYSAGNHLLFVFLGVFSVLASLIGVRTLSSYGHRPPSHQSSP